MKFDLVETWLDTVSHTHSGSRHTTDIYRHRFNEFLHFIESSAQDITEDYEKLTEKAFKRKYAMMVKAYISALTKQGLAPNSVTARVTAVKSFFKYNDLPLGFIPNARIRIVFHNRDINKEEIVKILEVSRPRERAFFTMMAQTGLRPITLCLLKKKHIEPDFSTDAIPCCVKIPEELAKGKYRGHITFMAEDTVRALKAYFATRSNMTEDSPIFSGYGEREEQYCDRQIFTNSFRRIIETLKKKELIDFEQKQEGKPRSLRLYNLRKWFRKQAHQAGFEIVQHWMGHVVKAGVDEHYRPRDIEFHRKLYAEKAMPHLRLETATPSETDKMISRQQKEIEKLGKEMATLKTDYATLKTNYEALTSDLESSALETARKKLLSEIASQALEDAKNEMMQNPCAKYEELVKIMRKLLEKEETEKTEEQS